jgi:hypothetical protein
MSVVRRDATSAPVFSFDDLELVLLTVWGRDRCDARAASEQQRSNAVEAV